MNIDAFEVYKCPNSKIRVGNQETDGGYVICDNFGPYDCLLSAGIGGDIKFEEDFLERWNVPCFAFDGTETANFPKTSKNITFISKHIGIKNDDTTTNLIEYLEKYKNIFLKMDIEGSEFGWINNIPKKLLKNIKQIAIEYHYPLQSTYTWDAINRLNWSHFLIHLHPHPNCGYQELILNNSTNLIMPNVVECTYIRREFLEYSSDEIPGPLDKQNQITDAEKKLTGYPYNIL